MSAASSVMSPSGVPTSSRSARRRMTVLLSQSHGARSRIKFDSLIISDAHTRRHPLARTQCEARAGDAGRHGARNGLACVRVIFFTCRADDRLAAWPAA
mmetsp:Transcript_22700/g.57642  ORF Transcript_22700/g.57642 Transcript_22700/m.57642 type:complete len:99 (-) Transcript_22700:160-456(-)